MEPQYGAWAVNEYLLISLSQKLETRWDESHSGLRRLKEEAMGLMLQHEDLRQEIRKDF